MNDFRQRGAPCIKDLRGRGGLRKGIQQSLPGVVQSCGGKLSLPRQDFPYADVRLQDADGIGSNGPVGNAIDPFRDSQETRDGSIIEVVELGEDQILVTEPREFIRQQANGLRVEPPIARTASVNFRNAEENLQGAAIERSGKPKHALYNLFRRVPAPGFASPLGSNLRV